MAEKEDKPKFPRLLLCEGPEDCFFFHRLIEQRRLPDFHIWDAQGNRNFAGALRAYRIEYPRTFAQFGRILIVADNDDTPEVNFQAVRVQVEQVFGAGSAPTASRVRTTGKPSIAIMMMPWDKREGHLERLCLDSAHWADRINGEKTDHYLATVLADKWRSESRFGKAWLRANLAVRCASDPFIPLGKVFREPKHYHLVPVAHNSFKPIADYLTDFAS
ncbi:hypothetical protein V1283_003008 [Bradyrhizobium sp. AZCC 2262]|uniref:DUF3226 domain-containing protein n=1 Tax=Bradyrhizobium sp. AZCC 2262 TaxID=3117022 RepID=UPI002FF04DBB